MMIFFRQIGGAGLIILLSLLGGMAQAGQEAEKTQIGELCKIESNLPAFLGKDIEVSATYKAGFEMGWLDEELPCDPKSKKHKFRTVFDPDYRKATKKKTLKRFDKRMKLKNGDQNGVRTAKGVFRLRVRPYKKKNPGDVMYDYEIVIMEVVSLE